MFPTFRGGVNQKWEISHLFFAFFIDPFPYSLLLLLSGSGQVRWQAERRAAMQTILSYRRAKYGSGSRAPPAKLVWAGHEPQHFVNIFPEWSCNEEVAKINKEVSGVI